MYSLDWGYHLNVYTECVTEKDVVPSQLLCPVCKNEIEDESHELFRCNTYECFRKEVNIIATASVT